MVSKTRKRILIICSVFLVAMILYRQLGATIGFSSGQNADADYMSGTPIHYREEINEKIPQRIPDQLPNPDGDMGFDVRNLNLSAFDLTDQNDSLQKVCFNSNTTWPLLLPAGFNPESVLEIGKNPGLGIRKLHEEGYTGKSVGIAIIDMPLNLNHVEYKDNIIGYELLHAHGEGAEMHGSAVASMVVGKDCGVAPDADVYYIASSFFRVGFFGVKRDLTYMAKSIERALEINEILPEERKIRVISISCGFNPNTMDGKRVFNAIEKAKSKDILVITPSLEVNYGVELMGLGRSFEADPDQIESYVPGQFWEDYYYNNPEALNINNTLLIPMDSRTYGSWDNDAGYEFCSIGGLSWSVPWLAGMYALCVEVDHTITPEVFLSMALETGIKKEIVYNGGQYTIGTIMNPSGLIDSLQKENR